jgi:glucose-1-phosphate cytidylyltransferase
MQVVILAGGFGTRISEESSLRPKPMIEIGGKPLLWHIMKFYAHYGFTDFIICAGYKQELIHEYFARNAAAEPWQVKVVDTGLNTMTGGRVKRIQNYVQGKTFMLTYGDGVSNVDLQELAAFHAGHGKLATLTAVQLPQPFGILELAADNRVTSFREKQQQDAPLINGGFMVLEPGIFDYLADDTTVLEKKPLEQLAAQGQLMAYKHAGFWQCMDDVRQKVQLEKLWATGKAPWQVW